MPKIAVENKGPAPDYSDFLRFKKQAAIIRSQQLKVPADDPTVKPIIGREFHLQKGFESGIVQWKFQKGGFTQDNTRFSL